MPGNCPRSVPSARERGKWVPSSQPEPPWRNSSRRILPDGKDAEGKAEEEVPVTKVEIKDHDRITFAKQGDLVWLKSVIAPERSEWQLFWMADGELLKGGKRKAGDKTVDFDSPISPAEGSEIGVEATGDTTITLKYGSDSQTAKEARRVEEKKAVPDPARIVAVHADVSIDPTVVCVDKIIEARPTNVLPADSDDIELATTTWKISKVKKNLEPNKSVFDQPPPKLETTQLKTMSHNATDPIGPRPPNPRGGTQPVFPPPGPRDPFTLDTKTPGVYEVELTEMKVVEKGQPSVKVPVKTKAFYAVIRVKLAVPDARKPVAAGRSPTLLEGKDKMDVGSYVCVNAGKSKTSGWVAHTGERIPEHRAFETNDPDDNGRLMRVGLSLEGITADLAASVPGKFTFRISQPAANEKKSFVKLWKTRTKGPNDEITDGKDVHSVENEKPFTEFFVEGVHEGAAEREVTIEVEFSTGGAALCSDKFKLSVTPILTKFSAKKPAKATIALVGETRTANDGTQLVAFTVHASQPGRGPLMRGAEAITLQLDVNTSGCEGAIGFIQFIRIRNNLAGGKGANVLDDYGITGTKGNTYTFGPTAAGLQSNTAGVSNWMVDGRQKDWPFYAADLKTGVSAITTSATQRTDADSPAVPLGLYLIPAGRGSLPPTLPVFQGNFNTMQGKVQLDITFEFVIWAVLELPDSGGIYPLAYAQWLVRYDGVVEYRGGGAALKKWTPGANAGIVESRGITRSNDLTPTLDDRFPVGIAAMLDWR